MPEHRKFDNEVAMLEQLRNGDEDVLALLFQRHFASLMVYAQKIVSFEAAQDILSETFVKFWNHKEQFTTEASVYQWLKITVRNAALNQLRNLWRTELKEPGSIVQLEESFEQDIYEAAIESGLFARIVAEIETLPAQQQRIIRMFFLEGKDNATIASELHISVQAVKNQKVSALKVLRKTFSPEDLTFCLLAVIATVK